MLFRFSHLGSFLAYLRGSMLAKGPHHTIVHCGLQEGGLVDFSEGVVVVIMLPVTHTDAWAPRAMSCFLVSPCLVLLSSQVRSRL